MSTAATTTTQSAPTENQQLAKQLTYRALAEVAEDIKDKTLAGHLRLAHAILR